MTATVTSSPVVLIPKVVTVSIASVFASRYSISPPVLAASVATLFVVLASRSNDPLEPVLISRNPLAVIVPVADCVAPWH